MKRFLALLMAMVMIVTLAACGENQKINSTDTSTTTESGIESANDGNIDTTTIKGTDNSKSSTTEDNAENNTSTTSTNSGTQTTDRPSTSSTKPNSTTTAKPNTSTSNKTANSNTETTSSTTSSISKHTTSTSTTTTESLYYNVVFKLNGKNLSTNQFKKGEKITVPSAGSNKWYVWDKQVPSTMPSSDLLFNAVAIAGDAWAATTWEYDFNGCLTIHGTGRMSNFSENSQPWKEYKSEITAVKFDNTITEIGKYAFFGLENLTTVVIPNNITIIGSYSFANCNNIQSITFGQNVKYIGTQAFASSSDINTVKFLGTKTWFAKQGNYQTSITFSSYNNASLFSEYKSYAFSHQENWWPNY